MPGGILRKVWFLHDPSFPKQSQDNNVKFTYMEKSYFGWLLVSLLFMSFIDLSLYNDQTLIHCNFAIIVGNINIICLEDLIKKIQILHHVPSRFSGSPRLEICRDRRDRRSCKIFPSCVKFWGNNANSLGNYRVTYALNE